MQAAIAATSFNPWVAGATALVGVGALLYMNYKEQNTELQSQNKLRDDLMSKNAGNIQGMEAEIDRIKTQINLQRERIGLSRIYQDELDKELGKSRKIG